YIWYLLLFIFFFQAEDGIRDRNVTGVQTCALPISIPLCFLIYSARRSLFLYLISWNSARAFVSSASGLSLLISDRSVIQPEPMRSEERRVGKECRSSWSQAAKQET